MAVSEEKIKEYIKMNQTIVLATMGNEGIPDMRTLLGYGITDYNVYFATDKASNKVKQLADYKKVSVLFQHENQFIARFFNVTIYGDALLVENDQEFEKGKELILSRKPHLKITKDTHNIYRVSPKRVKALDFTEQNSNERITIIDL